MEILNTTPLTKTNAVKGGNLTPLKKYEPEKLVMPRLPKFMIPKFATSEGGATDTMSEYVYKLSEMRNMYRADMGMWLSFLQDCNCRRKVYRLFPVFLNFWRVAKSL